MHIHGDNIYIWPTNIIQLYWNTGSRGISIATDYIGPQPTNTINLGYNNQSWANVGSHKFEVYGVEGTDYERGFLKWTSNTFNIGTEKGGGGTQRGIRIDTATIGVGSNPLTAEYLYFGGTKTLVTIGIDYGAVIDGDFDGEDLIGILSTPRYAGTNATAIKGLEVNPIVVLTYTAEDLIGIRVHSSKEGNITATYGIKIDDVSGAGTTTYDYGLYISDIAAGTTYNYNIFSTGASSKNYFQGSEVVGGTYLFRDTNWTNSQLSIFRGTLTQVYTAFPTWQIGVTSVLVGTDNCSGLFSNAHLIDGSYAIKNVQGAYIYGSGYARNSGSSINAVKGAVIGADIWADTGRTLTLNEATGIEINNYYGYDGTLNVTDFHFLKLTLLPYGAGIKNITNAYGIRIPDMSGVGTTSYNIHSAGVASRNYFQGNLEFGNAATTIAALADTIRLYGDDYATGDARLYVQSEQGNPIIIGKNEVQLFNVSGINYERAYMKWDTNVFKIGTEAGGSGAIQGIRIDADSIGFGYGPLSAYYINIGETRTFDEIEDYWTIFIHSQYSGSFDGGYCGGIRVQPNLSATGCQNLVGIYSEPLLSEGSTVQTLKGVYSRPRLEEDSTTDYLHCLEAEPQISGIINNDVYGLRVDIYIADSEGVGVTGTAYGIKVEAISGKGADTNNYNIYSSGLSSVNAFEGQIQQYNVLGTDYERSYLKWDSNTFKIGTEKGGLGTQRSVFVNAYGINLRDNSGINNEINITGVSTRIDHDALIQLDIDGTSVIEIDWAEVNSLIPVNAPKFFSNIYEDINFDEDEVMTTGLGASFGILIVRDSVDNITGVFMLENQSISIISANILYSITEDTADKYNVYWETDQFKVQNKVGDNKNIRVGFYGV